jgi:hypothetical protein
LQKLGRVRISPAGLHFRAITAEFVPKHLLLAPKIVGREHEIRDNYEHKSLALTKNTNLGMQIKNNKIGKIT